MHTEEAPSSRIIFLVFLFTALLHCIGIAVEQQETILSAKTIKGDFASNQDIPINLVAGSPEQPEMLILQQIRFETAYGNAWKVMGRLQWQPVETANWRITIELMDSPGRDLRHPLDNPVNVTTVKVNRHSPEPLCAEVELDIMQFEQRFHAKRFRLRLERLAYHGDSGAEHAMILTARDQHTKKVLHQAVLQAQSYDRSTFTKRVKRLYGMDSLGHIRANFPHRRSIIHELEVHCPGHATVSKRFSDRDVRPNEYEVFLPLAGRMGGTVLNENRHPVSNVWVTIQARQPLESATCSLFRAVKTDQQGKWTCDGIPKEAEHISLKFKHPMYRDQSSRFTGISTDHQQILRPGLAVHGLVNDEYGKPVQDAVVHMLPMGYGGYRDNYMHVLTDERGCFSFGCGRDDMTNIQSEKGVALLLVEVPGYLPAIKQIKMGPDTPEVPIRLAPGHSVSGQVTDKQGNPISDAWTAVHPFPKQYKSYGLWQSFTDAQGRFTLEHMPEHVLLTVGKQDYITVRDLPFPPETGDPVVHMIPAIHMTGNVTNATTGKPVNSFELSVCPVDDNGTPKPLRNQYWESFQQGIYEKVIDESFTGKRVVMIRADGYNQSTSPSFGMDQGNQSLDVSLIPDPSYKIARPKRPQKQVIEGIVLDPRKAPAANVTISTYGRYAPAAISSQDGTFKLMFASMNERDEACVVVARDQQNNLAAALDSMDPAQRLTVQLESGVLLLGKVVDTQGNGLPQADISLTLWHGDMGYGGQPEQVAIQKDGCFVITAVPRYQRYSVRIKAPGYGSDYIEVKTHDEVSKIQMETQVLKQADQSITGVVLDRDGNPIPEIRISVHGRGQPYLQTKADNQGKFMVQGLVDGQVRLQANMSGERRMHGRAEVQAGDQNIKIIAEERDSRGRPIPPKRKSLQGQSIPAWEELGLSETPEAFRDKPMLICFWDMEQRPARRAVIQAAQKAQSLKDRGVGVLLVHAASSEKETLEQWLKKNRIPFANCFVKTDFEKKKRQWGIESLPWLILTDKSHIVRAEGFGIDELETLIKE